MRQKRNRQRTIFEVLGKNPSTKEFEQMALVLDANPEILDLAFEGFANILLGGTDVLHRVQRLDEHRIGWI